MIKYHLLFEVKFFHNYYEEYTSKDFDILLPKETLANLSSYQLIYKQTLEGFVVFYKEDQRYLLERLKEEVSLNFEIILKNKYFRNFSKITSINSSKKYLFTNREGTSTYLDQEKFKLNQIKLHNNGFVDEKNVCLYCHENSILKELFSDDEVLIKQKGETLFEGKLEGWENAIGILGSNYGSYNIILKNSDETLRLRYLQASLSNTFSTVDIIIGGKATNFTTVNGSEYHIKFENRSILWSYYFVPHLEKSYESVDLFVGKQKLQFSAPEKVVLVNGQRALKVTSSETIPLKKIHQGQQLFAELKEYTSDTAHELVKKKINLPTPDVTRIKGKRINDIETYFSEMYIYL